MALRRARRSDSGRLLAVMARQAALMSMRLQMAARQLPRLMRSLGVRTWAVMFDDEEEFFELFVIEGADDFQIADEGIEPGQIVRVATVKAGGDAPELLAALEQRMRWMFHA
jgi:hypothetical protein